MIAGNKNLYIQANETPHASIKQNSCKRKPNENPARPVQIKNQVSNPARPCKSKKGGSAMNQDFKRLLKNKQVLKAAASCLVLLVLTISAAALLGDRTAAWFSNNKNVNAGGMTVSVANERYRFDDSFSVKAMLNNVELASATYKRSGLGTDFYLVDENGDFVKNGENYQPPFFDSLFPGEYLEFTFRITCTEGMKNRGYRILFRNFGKEADTLFTTGAVVAAPAATYSV